MIKLTIRISDDLKAIFAKSVHGTIKLIRRQIALVETTKHQGIPQRVSVSLSQNLCSALPTPRLSRATPLALAGWYKEKVPTNI